MSRLDDELRLAFKREEPSADFTARLLARIAAAEKPQPTLWQRLREFFSPTVMRWAIATAALLLAAAVALIQYQNRSRTDAGVLAGSSVNHQPFASAAKIEKLQDLKDSGKPNAVQENVRPTILPVTRHLAKHRVQPRVHHEPEQSRIPEGEIALENHHKSKGEIAKEQLYKALAITTDLLQEAKDIALTGGK